MRDEWTEWNNGDEWTEWNKGRMKESDERKNDTNSNRNPDADVGSYRRKASIRNGGTLVIRRIGTKGV